MNKEQLKQLISANKIDQAIEQLLIQIKDEDFRNEALLVKNRRTQLKRDTLTKTISREEQGIESRLIQEALLQLIDRIEIEDVQISPTGPLLQPRGCSIAVAMTFVIILLTIIAIQYYNKKEPPTSETIIAEDATSIELKIQLTAQEEVIKLQEGKVAAQAGTKPDMLIEGQPKADNTIAFIFPEPPNVPIKFILDSWQYALTAPEQWYPFQTGIIRIPVKKKPLVTRDTPIVQQQPLRLSTTVVDYDTGHPLPKIRVAANNGITDTTDDHGQFLLEFNDIRLKNQSILVRFDDPNNHYDSISEYYTLTDPQDQLAPIKMKKK